MLLNISLIEAFAVMFILFVCNDFLCNSGHEDWLEVYLPRIEQYFVPNLMAQIESAMARRAPWPLSCP